MNDCQLSRDGKNSTSIDPFFDELDGIKMLLMVYENQRKKSLQSPIPPPAAS